MSTRHIPRLLGTRGNVLTTFVIATGALAMSAQSHATVIRFDNPPGPGNFLWNNNRLDITLDAFLQPVGTVPTSFRHAPASNGLVSRGAVGAAVQADVTGNVLVPLMAGDLVDNSGLWQFSARVIDPANGITQPLLPEGVETYLGVSITLDGQIHYGWIGVVVSDIGSEDYQLDPFAWGYETEPGVPIAAGAPEPGTLALLAFGAGALLRRRAG